MWLFFFFLALVCVLALMFYIVVELNELDKTAKEFGDEVRNYYES